MDRLPYPFWGRPWIWYPNGMELPSGLASKSEYTDLFSVSSRRTDRPSTSPHPKRLIIPNICAKSFRSHWFGHRKHNLHTNTHHQAAKICTLYIPGPGTGSGLECTCGAGTCASRARGRVFGHHCGVYRSAEEHMVLFGGDSRFTVLRILGNRMVRC